MKLGKVTTNDTPVRQPLRLKSSTLTQTEAYRRYYKEVHGDTISLSTVIEEMIRAFMRDDKAFQRFLAEESAKQVSTSAEVPKTTKAKEPQPANSQVTV